MEKILETERLFLREMTMDDFDALYAVLADPEIMQHSKTQNTRRSIPTASTRMWVLLKRRNPSACISKKNIPMRQIKSPMFP